MDKRVQRLDINGKLRVYYYVKDKLPIFYANILLYRGSAHELGYKRGIHNFMLKLLTESPEGFTPSDFSRELDRRGLRISARSGYFVSNLELDGVSDYFSESLNFSVKLLKSPALREEDFKRLKEQYKSAVILALKNPEFVTNYFTNYFYFKEMEPLRVMPEFGLVKDVLSLQYEEVKDYYQNFLRNLKLDVVVVSNLDLERDAGVFNELSDFVTKGEEKFSVSDERAEFDEVYVVDMDIAQAHLRIVIPAPHRRHEDYLPTKVANFIFGGSDLSSRLMKRLRIEKGLTYSVGSSYNPGISYGGNLLGPHLSIYYETELKDVKKSLDLIIEEVERIKTEGFTEEELQDAVAFYRGSTPLRVESYSQILTLLTEEIIYNLPFWHWEEEVERMGRLEVSEINNAFKKYFKMEKPFILVTGKASKLEKVFKDRKVVIIDPHTHFGLG